MSVRAAQQFRSEAFQHERRFLLDAAAAESFIAAVAPHTTPELYDATRPVAYVRTTYLDTDDLTYLRSCERGPVHCQLRLREYAAGRRIGEPAALTGICFLEYKETVGALSRKERFLAPANALSEIVRGHGRTRGVWDPCLALHPMLEQLLQEPTLAPRLTTFYPRSSMIGDARRLRITLDERVAFCEPCPIGAGGECASPRNVIATDPTRILELKYRDELPSWLEQAITGFTEAIDFSKFKRGMAAVASAGVWRRVA